MESGITAVLKAAKQNVVDSPLRPINEIHLMLMASHERLVAMMDDAFKCGNIRLHDSLRAKACRVRLVAEDLLMELSDI